MNKELDAISVELLKAGDRAEFARMVDAYSNRIYLMALKILNDPQDAEDVLQETFLKAFRSLTDFEGRSSLSTWIYRIATNEALMLLRKRHPQVVSLDEKEDPDAEDFESPVQITDWCCLPERELVSVEARKHLDQAIQNLPETMRIVFVLRDIEGLSIHETGEILGLSEVAVKTRLFRARIKLREELTAYFGERLTEKTDQ